MQNMTHQEALTKVHEHCATWSLTVGYPDGTDMARLLDLRKSMTEKLDVGWDMYRARMNTQAELAMLVERLLDTLRLRTTSMDQVWVGDLRDLLTPTFGTMYFLMAGPASMANSLRAPTSSPGGLLIYRPMEWMRNA
jgi:hypothetical protein